MSENSLILMDYYLKFLNTELKTTWFWQTKKKKKLQTEIDRILKKRAFTIYRMSKE